jgi:hypothetical protein
VQGVTVPLLTDWKNFFSIIGTASATLVGLMFVVIAFTTNIRRRRAVESTLGTFNTPNIVHFCIALFIAMLLSAPWSGLAIPGLLLGLIGLCGTIYVCIILWRFTRLQNYKPVLEDWAWHVVIPFACYVALFIAAVMLLSNPILAMFFVGTVAILFLFIGIHNAWDIITFITIELLQTEDRGQDS